MNSEDVYSSNELISQKNQNAFRSKWPMREGRRSIVSLFSPSTSFFPLRTKIKNLRNGAPCISKLLQPNYRQLHIGLTSTVSCHRLTHFNSSKRNVRVLVKLSELEERSSHRQLTFRNVSALHRAR